MNGIVFRDFFGSVVSALCHLSRIDGFIPEEIDLKPDLSANKGHKSSKTVVLRLQQTRFFRLEAARRPGVLAEVFHG